MEAGFVLLSAYAEDLGCKAGDECVKCLLLRRDVRQKLLCRTDLVSAEGRIRPTICGEEARRAKAGFKGTMDVRPWGFIFETLRGIPYVFFEDAPSFRCPHGKGVNGVSSVESSITSRMLSVK